MRLYPGNAEPRLGIEEENQTRVKTLVKTVVETRVKTPGAPSPSSAFPLSRAELGLGAPGEGLKTDPLPTLTESVVELSGKVDAHLKTMGLSW